MLELILGAAGTGKTALLYEKLKDWVAGGGRAILLVPEQASFEGEKALHRLLGPQSALSVEVLSFTRLCDRIFREYGGLAGTHLDGTAKYLLMSVALEELEGQLEVYRKNRASAAFVATICETVGELKAAGATPEDLRRAAAQSGPVLAGKLREIALIFETWQAIVDRGYQDPDDAPTRACRRLEGNGFFAGCGVFIDGFMSFMGAEWKLLARILEGSPRVTAAFCCEGLAGGGQLAGPFSAASQTARRMAGLARQVGAQVAPPTLLRQQHRFQAAGLLHLAASLPQLRPEPLEQPGEGVQLVGCEDVYDELEYVAAQIVRLAREEGYRYRQIAVIGRDLDRYLVPLQTVFGRYGIPFFADLRVDVQVHPLASGTLCALDAVRSGFETEYLLALSKNCISGLDPLEAGALENYCYLWGVNRAAWKSDFQNHPDGMEAALNQEQAGRLRELNRIRSQLAGPLLALAQRLEGCSGRAFAAGVFAWLEQSQAVQHLQAFAQGMAPEEQKRFLDLSVQVWDLLLGILDVFGGALAETHLPLARYVDLLRLCLASADVGLLPQTLDQVIVGQADRVRPDAPKAVFVIGANEGVFPRWSAPAGVFSAAERDRLRAEGIDLLQTPENTLLFERYFLYFALTRASHRLWVTWPARDAAGEGLSPSAFVGEVGQLLRLAPQSTRTVPALAWAANGDTAFDQLTRLWGQGTAEEAALRGYFAQTAPGRLENLAKSARPRQFQLSDYALARALFGETMRLSPSRVERYYSCAFSYFCQAGLRLRPRGKVDYDPIQSGSLIHLVLEKMVRRHGGRGLAALPAEQLRKEAAQIIQQELSAKIAGLAEMPARFQFLFKRLVNILVRLLQRLGAEFAQSDYQPAAFELSIGERERVKPLHLVAADGTQVVVEGIVDRVDLLRRGGRRYVRVVDYKSGQKVFRLSDVYYGLNLQMLIYLFALCDSTPGMLPGGVLYMPAMTQMATVPRDASPQAVQAEQQKRLRMNGLLLEDRESLEAMEPGLAGVFIPARLKKDGQFDANSSLANLAQMGVIRRQVEKLLTGLAESLHQGRIQALPAQGEGASARPPCDWCDYRSLCGHEEGDPVRLLAELDRQEALQAMKGGEQDG